MESHTHPIHLYDGVRNHSMILAPCDGRFQERSTQSFHMRQLLEHNALTTYYGVSNDRASTLMQNGMDAKRIHWYEGMSDDVVRDEFSRTSETNLGGWDGYYAHVAIEEGVDTVYTIDNDSRKYRESKRTSSYLPKNSPR